MVLTNAIAFNFLLCLFPLVLVVAGVSQQLPFGRGASAALLLVLQELIPFDHGALAQSLRTLSRTARTLEVFSLLLIVWGSSGIFMPVEMVLNKAWGGRAHRDFWKSRLLAFLMTMA
ncbi:MAG TPA: YhjD/YihY/BrkB family envelope integrity protein, partial [Vicinamibacteria bacterium]